MLDVPPDTVTTIRAVRCVKASVGSVVMQQFLRHADVVALGISVTALVCLHRHGGHRGLPVRIGPPCRYGDGTFSRPVVRVIAAEGGGKVVGRGGHAVCFHFVAYLDGDRSHALPVAVHRGAGAGGGCHFVAYLDGDRSHALPVAVHRGAGAGGGCRRGIQPRGGEGHGYALRCFGQQARIVLRAGGEQGCRQAGCR